VRGCARVRARARGRARARARAGGAGRGGGARRAGAVHVAASVQAMSARISWISRTPVKALALQHLDEADLDEGGVAGDRRFYLVGETGRLISNKDFPAFQLIRGAYDDARDELTLTLPDGRNVHGTVERGEEVTTSFHRRPRNARLVIGPWSAVL